MRPHHSRSAATTTTTTTTTTTLSACNFYNNNFNGPFNAMFTACENSPGTITQYVQFNGISYFYYTNNDCATPAIEFWNEYDEINQLFLGIRFSQFGVMIDAINCCDINPAPCTWL